MRKGDKWYKREPIAFMDGVEGMGPELIGVYAYVLDLIYARGGETERNDSALAGRIGCSKRKVTSLLDELIARGKLTVRGEKLTHKHAEEHASKSRARAEQAASAGRASAEKRCRSSKNNSLQEQTVPEKKEQNRIEENRKEKITKKDEPNGSLNLDFPDEISVQFEAFWKDVWPQHFRKKGKKDCERVYRAACEGKHKKADRIKPADLNRYASEHIKSMGSDLQFLQGPLVWLRAPGWEPYQEMEALGRSASELQAQSMGNKPSNWEWWLQ